MRRFLPLILLIGPGLGGAGCHGTCSVPPLPDPLPRFAARKEDGYYWLAARFEVETGITTVQEGNFALGCQSLDANGRLVLEPGFGWDGATAVPDGALLPASAVHDALDRLIRARALLPHDARCEADAMFGALATANGAPGDALRAGLRLAGRFGTRRVDAAKPEWCVPP